MPELYIKLDDGTEQPLTTTTDAALSELSFVTRTPATIIANMIAAAEGVLGRTLAPADPVRHLLLTFAALIIQERYNLDYAAKMNLIDYAEPPILNEIGARFLVTQLPAAAALTTLRVTLSAAQPGVITIPAGTRASTGEIVFATTESANIGIGDTTVDIPAEAVVAGESGNGFLAGQISQMVDILPYVLSIANTTTSEGGSDLESVANYRARIKAAIRSFSTAGPSGAYDYWARTANPAIIDVSVMSPLDLAAPTVLFDTGAPSAGDGSDGNYYIDTTAALLYGPKSDGAWGDGYDIIGARGQVLIYPLLTDGVLPGSEVLQQVEDACSPSTRRPLTDQVIVQAPIASAYDVTLTYYIADADAARELDIQDAVEQAVADYNAWQQAKIGRDINPSELIYRVRAAGALRVEVTDPAHTVLAGNQVAQIDDVTVTYGGRENG